MGTAPTCSLIVIYPGSFTGRSRMRIARSQSWLFMASTMSPDNLSYTSGLVAGD